MLRGFCSIDLKMNFKYPTSPPNYQMASLLVMQRFFNRITIKCQHILGESRNFLCKSYSVKHFKQHCHIKLSTLHCGCLVVVIWSRNPTSAFHSTSAFADYEREQIWRGTSYYLPTILLNKYSEKFLVNTYYRKEHIMAKMTTQYAAQQHAENLAATNNFLLSPAPTNNVTISRA